MPTLGDTAEADAAAAVTAADADVAADAEPADLGSGAAPRMQKTLIARSDAAA